MKWQYFVKNEYVVAGTTNHASILLLLLCTWSNVGLNVAGTTNHASISLLIVFGLMCGLIWPVLLTMPMCSVKGLLFHPMVALWGWVGRVIFSLW
jgi:hypothetical protein